MEARVVAGRRDVLLGGVHGAGAVDYIGDAASRADNLLQSVLVELAGDVEIEVLLVSLNGRFKGVVEIVGEVGGGVRDVAEAVEVSFELIQTVVGIPRTAAGEVLEGVPRAASHVFYNPRGYGGYIGEQSS